MQYIRPSPKILISDFSNGPFQIVNERVNLEVSGGGDFDLLIDTNDPYYGAYVAYDAWGNNHAISIEKLNDEYTDSLGSEASSGQIR